MVVDFEAELRRVNLIKKHGWNETNLNNELTLDLNRLFRGYPKDLKRRIREEKKRGQVDRPAQDVEEAAGRGEGWWGDVPGEGESEGGGDQEP